MSNKQPVNVGLKDKVTNKLVAVFPHSIEGSQEEIEKKVFDWYYAQGCSNENELPKLFVDVITEDELKNFH
ncbi:hypothetical protein [Acetivibrio cellulolyticus]|uniref:hypothetical protein n=1 Tax=Acetivibrio cellulolyticus TaxID=35830 RepID=UPI0001E2D926|nr:hypothetical protein [Acetivibrio cellulolyticus]